MGCHRSRIEIATRHSLFAIREPALTFDMHVDILHPPCRPSTSMPTDPTLSKIELLQGTLDFIILQTLRWGPRHGYGLAQMIRASSNDLLQVETGSLYPALHRLAKKKWIEADWDVSENGQ